MFHNSRICEWLHDMDADIQFVQLMREQLTRDKNDLTNELEEMMDKFVDVQRGVVWDGDSMDYSWTDAKLQERFQLLSRQCNGDDGLFNRVDRFLMKNASHHHRLESDLFNNPHAYANRCACLMTLVQRSSFFTGNRYRVGVL